MIDVEIEGFHVLCPHCQDELRISGKYVGHAVACKFCRGQFRLMVDDRRIKVAACYLDCPHCHKELRVAPKYIGAKVACKFCDGQLHIQSRLPAPAR